MEFSATTSAPAPAKARDIVTYGNPVLRTKGRAVGEINDDVRQLAADMLATMHAAHGLGLAAQQVGVPLQLTVLDVSVVNQEERPSALFIDGEEAKLEDWMPLILVNPQLELVGRERETASEGCLSFPDIHADIRRALRVRVHARRLDGGEVAFEATGLLARALQHEVDHLQGVLFIDRMNSATRAGLAGRLKRLQRENERR
ncbi:MAG: peptide deformylase [Verrucomicrobia bacterium]|nr:peptide deformylase [Verrucomicrobiota bacterium]MBV9658581.1 peptide deformylase [Verrucomicrobiota bacterium]